MEKILCLVDNPLGRLRLELVAGRDFIFISIFCRLGNSTSKSITKTCSINVKKEYKYQGVKSMTDLFILRAEVRFRKSKTALHFYEVIEISMIFHNLRTFCAKFSRRD